MAIGGFSADARLGDMASIDEHARRTGRRDRDVALPFSDRRQAGHYHIAAPPSNADKSNVVELSVANLPVLMEECWNEHRPRHGTIL